MNDFLLTLFAENSIKILFNKGSLTQLVEYLPFKQRVARSSRARPTKYIYGLVPIV